MKKMILIMIVLIILFLFIFIYVVNNNNNYINNRLSNIKNNYKITDNVIYSNEYGEYYILLTEKNLIILNKKYDEIMKEKIENLKLVSGEYDIIYIRNKPMLQLKEKNNNKIVYIYYDIYTGKEIEKIEIEG